MKITFCGANREVTGSCYHIQTKHASIVLDCGMFQGGKLAEDKNATAFPFDPASVDAVVVTHAHFDHIGRLPKLYKEGFRGSLWCTEPTGELSMITLRDSAHLIADEAERHEHAPLYTGEDVEPLENLWRPVAYHYETEIAPGATIYLTDAGHILGSASVRIRADGQLAAFSGDLGNAPVPLLRSTQSLDAADVVVIESTYGNRIHEGGVRRMDFLKQAILDTVRNRGVLLIPAFALERTQELLYEMNHLLETGQVPHVPVYLDSPLAIAATAVFKKHADFFNTAARQEIARGEDLFSFPDVTFTRDSEDSKAILNAPGPKIIIAGSGMMNGGRILHHLKNYLGQRSTLVLVIGYQVEGSLGRSLHDGAKKVHIYGQEVEVHAEVRSCGAFSGHADYPRLMHWLNGFQSHQPSNVFVTHGELNSALSFSESVEEHLGISAGVPSFGESVDIARLSRLA